MYFRDGKWTAHIVGPSRISRLFDERDVCAVSAMLVDGFSTRAHMGDTVSAQPGSGGVCIRKRRRKHHGELSLNQPPAIQEGLDSIAPIVCIAGVLLGLTKMHPTGYCVITNTNIACSGFSSDTVPPGRSTRGDVIDVFPQAQQFR